MTVSLAPTFNPAPVLLGSRRNKSAGWSKGHPTTKKTMLAYTENAVKGIVKRRPRRLLGLTRNADRDDLAALLEYTPIARRGRGSVGSQSSIKSHVCGRYTHYVGGFSLRPASQDKRGKYLLVYSPLASLNYGVGA